MKKITFSIFIFLTLKLSAQQNILFSPAKFKTGDNAQWKEKNFDDALWSVINPKIIWEEQGYDDYNGYAWYRFHFILPSSLKTRSFWKDSLNIMLGKIDDVDEVFLNGKKIGQTGMFPTDPGGYAGKYDEVRSYHVATNDNAIEWDKENTIAIRVYDGGGGGGMFESNQFVTMMDIIDGAELSLTNGNTFQLQNHLQLKLEGSLIITQKDGEQNKIISTASQKISLGANQSITKQVLIPETKRLEITATFKEKNTGKTKSVFAVTPYILTPKAQLTPKINGATVFGIRPGSPFLYKIAASGEKPLHYEVIELPKGLYLDANTGIITGMLENEGDYKMNFIVSNARGKNERAFTVKVGNTLSLTPPMGWNSWNCWGLSVSEEKVKSSAQALIDKGLTDHGWTYMNIDDGWERMQRADDGTIVTNEKFPDMKGLGNWLHSHGLKFGIYSSPGTLTCGGYTASYQHEMQDATSYANWGIDYLKYDWCSYGEVYKNEGDTSVAAYMKPYQVMQHALKAQSRDIHYSLCQYGMKDVWKWGDKVDGNSWRTTGDIVDTWESLSDIGFKQNIASPYSQPGHWNDPDMLIVGQVGWGENLHPTRLTPDEQYTHISLWCLLSSPLLIGCDISKLDDFTLNLLSNDEVLAIDQDALGKGAMQVIKTGNYQVWMKDLEDGTKAIGIFNLSEKYQTISINWDGILPDKKYNVRDLWREKNLGTFKDAFKTTVTPHGVTLIKITK